MPLEEVLKQGRFLMVLLSLWGALDAINLVLGGALKGAGDTRFVLICTSLATWLIWIPGEAALILWFDAGLVAAWLWMTVFVLLLSIGFWFRFRSGRWKTIEMIQPEPPAVEGKEKAIDN